MTDPLALRKEIHDELARMGGDLLKRVRLYNVPVSLGQIEGQVVRDEVSAAFAWMLWEYMKYIRPAERNQELSRILKTTKQTLKTNPHPELKG